MHWSECQWKCFSKRGARWADVWLVKGHTMTAQWASHGCSECHCHSIKFIHLPSAIERNKKSFSHWFSHKIFFMSGISDNKKHTHNVSDRGRGLARIIYLKIFWKKCLDSLAITYSGENSVLCYIYDYGIIQEMSLYLSCVVGHFWLKNRMFWDVIWNLTLV